MGGAGDDRLNGTTGSDLLYGGLDNDTYLFGASSAGEADQVFENTNGGIDTLSFASVTTSVNVHLAVTSVQSVHTDRTVRLNSDSTFENVMGGSAADVLTGNGLDNTLIGWAGDDRLNGTTGSDLLYGGLDNDTYLFGASSTGEVDQVFENPNGGIDTLNFSSQTTSVNVHLAVTSVQSVHTDRSVRLNSDSKFENVMGGSAADVLTGNGLDNTLIGWAGEDRLNGTTGSDLLYGGLDNDTYLFGASSTGESDQVFENPNGGIDTLSFASQTTSVNVNLAVTSVQSVHTDRTVRLNSDNTFENVMGGSAADTLTGNNLDNTLIGWARDDKLNGTTGSDLLYGGLDNDTYLFRASSVGEADQMFENFNGGVDTLNFVSQTISIVLNLGLSTVQSVHTDRTLKLNSDSTFENALGGSGDDTLLGNSLANTLNGGNGNNILVGLPGDDLLEAGNGRDLIIGSAGLDTINGGAGDDILIAGRTTSDVSVTDLTTLRSEWISGNAYADRVASLRLGVGNPVVSLKAQENVLNDAGEDDLLTGGAGLDWYFRAIDDAITDIFASEIIDVL
jgi:Ca2+-binding RTX toxin-like protein